MTPREVLAALEGLGYRLSLRPGGLRLTGPGEPPPGMLALVQEHRSGLLSLMEAEEQAWAAHQASLDAGRLTAFPAHLVELVDPALSQLCARGLVLAGVRRQGHFRPLAKFR